MFQRLKKYFIGLGADDGVAVIQHVGRHAGHSDLIGFLHHLINRCRELSAFDLALHFVRVQPDLQSFCPIEMT